MIMKSYANDQFYLRTSREIRRLPSAVDQLRRLVDLSVPGYLPEYGRLDEWALWIEVWVRALRDPDTEPELEAVRLAILFEDILGVSLSDDDIDLAVLSDPGAVEKLGNR